MLRIDRLAISLVVLMVFSVISESADAGGFLSRLRCRLKASHRCTPTRTCAPVAHSCQTHGCYTHGCQGNCGGGRVCKHVAACKAAACYLKHDGDPRSLKICLDAVRVRYARCKLGCVVHCKVRDDCKCDQGDYGCGDDEECMEECAYECACQDICGDCQDAEGNPYDCDLEEGDPGFNSDCYDLLCNPGECADHCLKKGAAPKEDEDQIPIPEPLDQDSISP